MMQPTTQTAVEHIIQHLRRDDILELLYHRGSFVPADVVADIMKYPGFALVCYSDDDEPIAVGGINNEDNRFSTAWAIGTPRFMEKALEITKACRSFCREFVTQNPQKDLLAFSWDGHPLSAPWLEAVGFEPKDHQAHNGQPFTLFMMPRGEHGHH